MAIRSFAVPKKPEGFEEPYRFPEDITKLNSEQLGAFHSMLTAFRGYARYLLGTSEIKKMWEKTEFKKAYNKEYYARADSYTKVNDLKTEVSQLDNIVDLEEKMMEREKQVIYFEMLVDIYNDQKSAVSREISRRRESE